MFETIDTPAPWAYNWCWVYFLIAIGTVIGALVALIFSWKKLNLVSMIALVLVTVVQVAHGLTYFWVCRSSLKPKLKLQ